MRIVALALAEEGQRFVPGYPPRGSRLFLRPNIEVSRLAGLLSEADQLVCRDQRVEPLEWAGPTDVCLVHVGFGHENQAREVAAGLERSGDRYLLFGPAVTSWGERPPSWVRARVEGDILSAWDAIRADLASGNLRDLYRGDPIPQYFPPGRLPGRPHGMNTRDQTTMFVLGCDCVDAVRQFCRLHLYYGQNRLVRTRDEIVGEVMTLPGKQIRLLDDDVSKAPDYYYEVFRSLWNYRKLWTVNAGDDIFRHPELVSLMAKAGARIIHLNESFLEHRLREAARDERLVKHLYRKVKYLQSRRMLVGARVSITLASQPPDDFRQIADVLKRTDLDFLSLRLLHRTENGETRLLPVAYEPMLERTQPAWAMHRFYSIGRIANRLVRRPRRTGFYTTAMFLLPYSLAYRQDFLEGVPAV